jgi:molybdopterin-guanine dinucleotide biosynthesis protein A
MSKPLGVILAGGRATRMGGGDKPLRIIGGRTILSRVADRFTPHCADLLLNVNGDPERFAGFSLPVAQDSIEGFAGPLAGILAGLDLAATLRPDITDILSLPADCPFLPPDLVQELEKARKAEGVPLASAASGGWTHPTVGLWPVSIRETLRQALIRGERKIDRFTSTLGVAYAEWSIEPFDPFFNANTPEDIVAAEEIAARWPDA